jgi:hypothetical protein
VDVRSLRSLPNRKSKTANPSKLFLDQLLEANWLVNEKPQAILIFLNWLSLAKCARLVAGNTKEHRIRHPARRVP